MGGGATTRGAGEAPGTPRAGATLGSRDPAWWQVPALVLLSAGYECLFLHHGLNAVDEGWPLYAAMQLERGGALYRDVFFVFPPGHLLPAWLARAIAPPGVIGARVVYAAFNVALCVALYGLGRRLMPPTFALAGAALLAVATPNGHVQQLLFGYRYLLFPVLAFLAFSQRLRGGGLRWMGAAGVALGVGLCFRLTPGLAAGAGLAAGLLVRGEPWRERLREGAWLASGVALAVAPVALWALLAVGAETVWREVLVRPVAMTALQDRPMPALRLPSSSERHVVTAAFVGALFRAGLFLYAAYAVGLAARWVRARARGARFGPVLLLAFASFGGVFFTRSLGRSDEPHLMSAIPPLCLLLAHALWLGVRALPGPQGLRRFLGPVVAAAAVALWIFGSGSDRALDPEYLGTTRLAALDGRVSVRNAWIDDLLPRIEAVAPSEGRLLVLGPESLLFVLTGLRGPGWADVIMPGTFLDDAEEEAFLARLRADPPAVVVMPRQPFDLMPSRGVDRQAPRLWAWVRENYGSHGVGERYTLLVPRAPRSAR